MRSIVIFLMMAVSVGFCQTESQGSGTVGGSEAEALVRTILSRPDGMYSSWDEKALAKFGDASAVALTRVFGEKDPSPTEVSLCLAILRSSFWYPRSVVIKSDRAPQTALFVLKRLEGMQLSSDLKEEIVETRKRILSTRKE
jgi:hypothetical protein